MTSQLQPFRFKIQSHMLAIVQNLRVLSVESRHYSSPRREGCGGGGGGGGAANIFKWMF